MKQKFKPHRASSLNKKVAPGWTYMGLNIDAHRLSNGPLIVSSSKRFIDAGYQSLLQGGLEGQEMPNIPELLLNITFQAHGLCICLDEYTRLQHMTCARMTI